MTGEERERLLKIAYMLRDTNLGYGIHALDCYAAQLEELAAETSGATAALAPTSQITPSAVSPAADLPELLP